MTTYSQAERWNALLAGSMAQTPLIRLHDDRLDLFAKLEFNNLSGSTKDRSALWILKQAIARGEITPNTTVVESSSGNFAMALASYCALLGISFVPVIDLNTNRSTEVFLQGISMRVEKVTEPDEAGGYLRSRLDRVRRLREEDHTVYWPNQYANMDGAMAHHRLTGEELSAGLSGIDYLFAGVGTGGTITGLSLRLKETFPGMKVIAVDAEGSVIFGGREGKRHIPGIGSSIVPPLLEHALIDDVVVVPEPEAIAACNLLWRRHAIFAGGSTGSVYAAIQRYFAGYRGRRPSVVFLCADRGTAYTETIYDPKWVSETYAQPLNGSLAISSATI